MLSGGGEGLLAGLWVLGGLGRLGCPPPEAGPGDDGLKDDQHGGKDEDTDQCGDDRCV